MKKWIEWATGFAVALAGDNTARPNCRLVGGAAEMSVRLGSAPILKNRWPPQRRRDRSPR